MIEVVGNMWAVLDKVLSIVISFFKVFFKLLSLFFTGLFSIIELLFKIIKKIFELIFGLFSRVKNTVNVKKQEEEYQRQLDES